MDFTKQALLDLMSHPNEISEKDEDELMEVVENYPYFQLGYSLLAKAKHDKQSPDAYTYLSKAAIYAPDRRKLRELFYDDLHIEQTFSSPSSNEEETDILDEETTQETSIMDESTFSTPESYNPPLEAEENTFAQEQEEEVIQSDEVYNELEENLRKLRESKNKFSEEEEENKKKIADEAEAENIDVPGFSATQDDSQEKDSSFLLGELTTQEVESKPFDTNQTIQNELIDKFINSQDSISFKSRPSVETDEQSEDLSYQSTEMSENLVSENLAEIYVKQGKKDKAIEIYQKLIWKFPQKKAYFAVKIESLKAE